MDGEMTGLKIKECPFSQQNPVLAVRVYNLQHVMVWGFKLRDQSAYEFTVMRLRAQLYKLIWSNRQKSKSSRQNIIIITVKYLSLQPGQKKVLKKMLQPGPGYRMKKGF